MVNLTMKNVEILYLSSNVDADVFIYYDGDKFVVLMTTKTHHYNKDTFCVKISCFQTMTVGRTRIFISLLIFFCI